MGKQRICDQSKTITNTIQQKLATEFFELDKFGKGVPSLSGNKSEAKELHTNFYYGNGFRDRKDVVHKSILRALRKFFRNEFVVQHPQPRFRGAQRATDYFENSLNAYMKKF